MPGSLQGQLHCCCRFQGRAPQERRPCDDDGKLSKGVCSSALHASSQPRPVASLARPRRPASIQHVPLVSSWLHGVGSRPGRLAHARATHMTCIPAGLLRWLPVCQRGCTWNAPGPAAARPLPTTNTAGLPTPPPYDRARDPLLAAAEAPTAGQQSCITQEKK